MNAETVNNSSSHLILTSSHSSSGDDSRILMALTEQLPEKQCCRHSSYSLITSTTSEFRARCSRSNAGRAYSETGVGARTGRDLSWMAINRIVDAERV